MIQLLLRVGRVTLLDLSMFAIDEPPADVVSYDFGFARRDDRELETERDD